MVALGLAVLLLLVYLQQSQGIQVLWVVSAPEQLCHTVRPLYLNVEWKNDPPRQVLVLLKASHLCCGMP